MVKMQNFENLLTKKGKTVKLGEAKAKTVK